MIFLTGHKGLVGSSLAKTLIKNKIKFKTVEKKILDLQNKNKVDQYFKNNKFSAVVVCAAKVGGIFANRTMPYDFIYKNLQIQNALINAAIENKVKKVIFLGSSCIYPKFSKQPMKESFLMNGDVEFTNRSYAIAKIAGLEMLWASNRQFKTNYIGLMPCNLYGENDNWDSINSHVIPGIINKIYNAIKNNKKSVSFWGTGSAKREFLHVDDLSEAILKVLKKKLMINNQVMPIYNVGSGYEISIKNLSNLIKKIMNYKGKILFDCSSPDGNPRKFLDSTKFKREFNWKNKISIESGLKKIIQYYLNKKK